MTTAPVATGPESLVVSLEYAKKLKEAGWPQDVCQWGWIDYVASREVKLKDGEYMRGLNNAQDYPEFGNPELLMAFAAPTAEEILRRLPRRTELETFEAGWTGKEYYVEQSWEVDEEHYACQRTYASTLANAAAAMYVHLAEQKLLPPVT